MCDDFGCDFQLAGENDEYAMLTGPVLEDAGERIITCAALQFVIIKVLPYLGAALRYSTWLHLLRPVQISVGQSKIEQTTSFFSIPKQHENRHVLRLVVPVPTPASIAS
jgi:hypothetical protein